MLRLSSKMPFYLIFLAIVVVYGQSIGFDFVFDDEHFVVKNIYLQSFSYLWDLLTRNIVAGAGMKSNLYRPLQSLTHIFDWQIWGSNSAFHHLSNIFIHCTLGFSFYRLLLGMYSRAVSLFTTLFFILHPLMHFAVAYISGRGDLLGMTFLCLGLIYSRNYYSILFFTLAMLSKESMAFFPFYLLIYEKMKNIQFEWKRYLTLSSVAAVYMILRLTVFNFKNTMNFYTSPNIFTENFHFRLFTFFTSFLKGFSLWILPYDLHHERGWKVFATFFQFQVVLGAILLALMISLVVYGIKNKKWWLLGFAWFVIAAFPTSNLLVIINAIYYDHWYILPGMGLMFVLAHGLTCFEKRVSGKTFSIVLSMMLLAFSGSTFYYTSTWKDGFSLYRHILKFEPKSAKALVNLAVTYSNAKQDDKAEELYKRALEIDGGFYEIHHNLGMIYFRRHEYRKAMKYYMAALNIKPSFFQSKKYLAISHYYLGETDQALNLLRQVKTEYPLDPDVDRLINQLQ